jgi:hypothetical protein
MYGSYDENHFIKQVKIKAILTLLKEPLKLYLDLNNSYDVLGFDVSKAYRLEKKEKIGVANKQRILIVTKDIVQQPDFDSSIVRCYVEKTSKWREKTVSMSK